jgi:ATP-dependent helicase HrpA
MTIANETARATAQALSAYHELRRALGEVRLPALRSVVESIERQMQGLIYAGFVSATPVRWLPHLARYLKAARLRLERAGREPARDSAQAAIVDDWLARLAAAVAKHPDDAKLAEFGWLIEELRVSLFAQALGTSVKVSSQRLEKAWAELEVNR